MPQITKVLTLNDLPAPPPGKMGWPWTEQSKPVGDRMSNGLEYPRISIVTPSYNQGQFIEETIRSVLLQGYPNLEYIIIDGGSTDNSVEVIKKYEHFLSYWVSEPDRGQAHAINKGLVYCSGEIFNWINSDDFLEESALQKVAENIEDVDMVAGACKNFRDTQKTETFVWNRNLTLKGFLGVTKDSVYHQPGVWIRLSKILKCGSLDEMLHYNFDAEFMIRLLMENPKINYLENILVNFRIHEISKTVTSWTGKDYFINDQVLFLKKFLSLDSYKSIHPYLAYRLRRVEWKDKLSNIILDSNLSSREKKIRIFRLIIEDPIVRFNRITLGALRKA